MTMETPKDDLHQDICFNFFKLPPSQWGDHFLSVPITDSDFNVLAREIEELKPKVREDIFSLSSGAIKRKILLIHLLISLGLSYYFENEIEETLKHAFEKIDDLIADENDLYTISIMFRVFRTYGHNMLSDVFNRFKGNNGKFKKSLTEDIKGMLSLYEAVHFGTQTDHILDEALSFTLNHLEPLATCHRASPPHLLKLLQKALHIPQHRNSQALVAREYISFYEQEEDRDETLHKLAKLNFKFLQLHYFQELKTITMWWRELNDTLDLPRNRKERTVESWFSALVINFEPQVSLGRIMSAKLYLLITFLDDACDIHGSIPEVTSLVDCLERWEPDYMGNLQGHMKSSFQYVMYVFKEYEEILRSQGRSFVLEKMIEEFKILVRSNLELIKWTRAAHMPNFDQYMEAGEAEVGAYVAMACSIMGLGEIGKKKDFELLRSRPKLVRSLAAKTRLMDDMTDYEDDMKKGYTANAVNYYMKQHGLTKEEANMKFGKMIGNINKIVNEECIKMTNISRPILNQFIGFGRLLDVLYTADDVFNHRDGKFKDYIFTLLIDPIHL
ncbi:PREDICTED: alpha-barbatene synthase-like [Camelina sativa]|uniref:Alpha-barbatene synthase-like n=1 Tax=Camelina sativa TaxID=90675 RepID=A0ABM0Y2L7_CAMSA|nr:PREDICTED: alpha-barbatene synthase-like [Camelina sativa]